MKSAEIKIRSYVRSVIKEAIDPEFDEEYIPDEIRQFMSDEEKDEYLEEEEPSRYATSYTLEDIVDTRVLRTKSPSGTLQYIEVTLDILKRLMTDDDFAEALVELKDNSFDDFSEARDNALDIWVQSASKVLGTDASKLPELSDNQFLNGFLHDFWFMETYIRPLIRQQNKGKDLSASLKSVSERWKYMTMPNRVQNFIKRVITPAFEFLTRDDSVAG